MKILCHVGPWCKDQFDVIAKSLCPSADIRFVSGFKRLDETGMVSAYYDYVSNVDSKEVAQNERDLEVIRRCRLLRSLNTEIARNHVSAMRRAVREMLANEKPDVVICESIDQFLHDILFQEAMILNIPAYGLIRSFANGYFRISSRGEFVCARQPDEDEVQTCLERFTDERYIPKNLESLKRKPLATYLRILLSNQARVLYFFFLRYISSERYNYHYWSSSRVTRKVYLHFMPRISLGVSDWMEKIIQVGKPTIYVPLQHFPEATVDYWSDDVEFIDYPEKLVELLTKLGSKFHLLVKEHPGVWGYRKPSFYNRLEKISAVTICPTNVPSQDCIAASDAVLVWTGSVGFEAALRGKPVLTTCIPYYSFGSRFKRISFATSMEEVSDFIIDCQAKPVNRDEQLDLVRNLLSGLLPGRFQNDGTFTPENSADIDDAKAIGKQLREFHESNHIRNTGS